MIHCNLATLLAQRNLKISKVFQDTGISRTTLTALAYNHAQGIQFDTLNTLCTYLNVTAADLIMHIPVEVTWTRARYADFGDWDKYETVVLTITERGRVNQYPLCLHITKNIVEGKPSWDVILSFTAPKDEPEMPVASEEDARKCKEIMERLPVEFISDLVNRMMRDFSAVDPNENEPAISFSWPFHTGWD